ncbi:MAG: LamG domain protein jellyroll fold domain protein, partial [Labilithrix sp.]|nr:LamG domain protein jellyroll fold domain protein [Labilithrix sp.]
CGADGGYRELVLCDQPAAYWRLGDLGPPSAINQADSGSAAAYIAADAGSITYGVGGAIAGDPDHAIHLDGTGLVNGGTALSFPGRAPYSIEAWVAPEGDNFSYRRIVEQVTYDSNGNAQDGYIIYNHETSAAEQYVDGSAAQVLGPPLGNLAYSHVVVTFDGGALRIYVNGALARTTAATAVPAAAVPATVFIGGNTRPGSGWIGKIDEVAIYAYPLDAKQVDAHYRAGHGP